MKSLTSIVLCQHASIQPDSPLNHCTWCLLICRLKQVSFNVRRLSFQEYRLKWKTWIIAKMVREEESQSRKAAICWASHSLPGIWFLALMIKWQSLEQATKECCHLVGFFIWIHMISFDNQFKGFKCPWFLVSFFFFFFKSTVHIYESVMSLRNLFGGWLTWVLSLCPPAPSALGLPRLSMRDQRFIP